MLLRLAVAPALAAILLTATAPAHADAGKPPDAAQVRQAAEQFDAGITAFKARDFEGAASRFEAADAAAPSAPALRQAIRSRAEAGQLSRAATLAAQALARYPDDASTTKLARETIEKAEPKLHKVAVTCAAPCVLAVGTRSIPGEPATRWTVYLDPGKTSLGASFSGGAGDAQKEINATAGGSSEARFEPPAAAAAKPDKPKTAEPPPTDAKTPLNSNEIPPEDPPPPPDKPPPRSGISPAFFIVGLVATAGVGGVTIWSAVDTETNPGPDAVKKACAGKGETCPLYQEGLKKQTRTNVLIGATAGTAALTTVFAIFTNWHGSEKKKPSGASVAPSAIFSPHGAVALATGTF